MLIAVILLGIGSPVISVASSPFADVPVNSVAYNAILWAHEKGLVTGSNGRFYPDSNMTRAQFALVLYRYAGRPAVGAGSSFSDIPASGGLYDAIAWAHSNGLVTGSNGRFMPENTITRAQMVLMLYRYNNNIGGDSSFNNAILGSFTDRGGIVPAATNAMCWAVTHGLITGSGSRLHPNDTITRAAVVLILYRYENNISRPNTSGTIRSNIDPNRPMIALTFDDGPSAFTVPILDALEQYGAVATFYVSGSRVQRHSNIVLRASDMGCEIASHSWSHRNLTGLSESSIRTELRNANTVIESVIGRPPSSMRPPYGGINQRGRNVAAELGLPVMLWSLDPSDYTLSNANTIYNRVISNVRNRDIILLHDTSRSTADAARRLIPALIERGYQLVTVSELMYYSGIETRPGAVYTSGRR